MTTPPTKIMPSPDLCESFEIGGYTYVIPINVVIEIERQAAQIKALQGKIGIAKDHINDLASRAHHHAAALDDVHIPD